jgi:myo-inositol-1-phosphate synthase
MGDIRVAIVGVGNCASSLVQGVAHYQNGGANDQIGLMHWDLGGYRPKDIRFVAAWDIDRRKVGADVAEAIFAKPNCTHIFCDHVPQSGVKVRMGRMLDGFSEHMADAPAERTFLPADEPQPEREDVVRALRETEAHVMLNYLPVGSQEATEFYAECALEAGVAFVNNIPVFIASDDEWARRFSEAGVPIIGDDIKAQVGATIVHRVLTDLFRQARRQARPDLPAQHRRQHRLPQHVEPLAARIEEDLEDRSGPVRRRAPARGRKYPYRPVRLCCLAE